MTHPLPQPSDEAVRRVVNAMRLERDRSGSSWESTARAAISAAHAELVARIAELEGWQREVCESLGFDCAMQSPIKWTPEEIWGETGNEMLAMTERAEAAERDRDHYKARANEAQESAQFWIGEHNEMERQRNALRAELAELVQRDEAGARDAEDARRYRWLKANGKPAADGLAMRKSEDWDAAIDRAAEGKAE